MSVVVDTSVWVDHFKNGNSTLINLLTSDRALMHPMVLAEIACGTPPERSRTLRDLSLLRSCQSASLVETMEFIEREALYGLGCGLVDLSLLASTLVTTGATLWTMDRRLTVLAERFRVAHRLA